MRILHFWFIKIHFYAFTSASIWTFRLAYAKWTQSKHTVFIYWYIWRSLFDSKFGPVYMFRRLVFVLLVTLCFVLLSRSGVTKFEFPPLNASELPTTFLCNVLVFQINKFGFYMYLSFVWYSHSSPLLRRGAYIWNRLFRNKNEQPHSLKTLCLSMTSTFLNL